MRVSVGESTDAEKNAFCRKYGKAKGKQVLYINCITPLLGRYVTVTIPSHDALTLCEVEVMGEVYSSK